jgi:protein SCO1/2
MLCTLILNGLVKSLRVVQFDAGTDFDVVAISFDDRETPEMAAAKKDVYMQEYGRGAGAAAGWHFLTGSKDSIHRVTQAAGFTFLWDQATGQFAHPSGVMVLTPQGRISRYFYGIEYAPRDLRLGLVEASANKIGTAVDQVLLYCYHYDPTTGKYGFVIMSIIRVLGTGTALALGIFMWVMFRRERRAATLSGHA